MSKHISTENSTNVQVVLRAKKDRVNYLQVSFLETSVSIFTRDHNGDMINVTCMSLVEFETFRKAINEL